MVSTNILFSMAHVGTCSQRPARLSMNRAVLRGSLLNARCAPARPPVVKAIKSRFNSRSQSGRYHRRQQRQKRYMMGRAVHKAGSQRISEVRENLPGRLRARLVQRGIQSHRKRLRTHLVPPPWRHVEKITRPGSHVVAGDSSQQRIGLKIRSLQIRQASTDLTGNTVVNRVHERIILGREKLPALLTFDLDQEHVPEIEMCL
jgi:hypothetical protein